MLIGIMTYTTTKQKFAIGGDVSTQIFNDLNDKYFQLEQAQIYKFSLENNLHNEDEHDDYIENFDKIERLESVCAELEDEIFWIKDEIQRKSF